MAKPGAYIRDVHSLEQLNDRIKSSGEMMANIDQNVSNHLNSVRDKLMSQLDYLQQRLSEAEARLREAGNAMNACHASQVVVPETGMIVPSCVFEESAVSSAQIEVESWRTKYNRGQQILGECQQEMAEYSSGGHALIANMSQQQTPKANQLLSGHIERLQDILGSDVGSTLDAVGAAGAIGAIAGGGGAAAAGGKFSNFFMGGEKRDVKTSPGLATEVDAQANMLANDIALEKALGVKRGNPMSTTEADHQSANPNHKDKYYEDANGDWYYYNGGWYKQNTLTQFFPETKEMSLPRYSKNNNYAYDYQYSVNCATTSAAYVMRKKGWPIWAKGDPQIEGNLNYELSRDSFAVWKNADGTDAKPSLYSDYMKKNGLKEMTPEDYKNFFEEECKENGIYQVSVRLKGSGHATILQRDDDGLHYIEPQVYEPDRTDEQGRRNIDDLVNRMAPRQSSNWGVMRVDDKLFDPKYADIFER